MNSLTRSWASISVTCFQSLRLSSSLSFYVFDCVSGDRWSQNWATLATPHINNQDHYRYSAMPLPLCQIGASEPVSRHFQPFLCITSFLVIATFFPLPNSDSSFSAVSSVLSPALLSHLVSPAPLPLTPHSSQFPAQGSAPVFQGLHSLSPAFIIKSIILIISLFQPHTSNHGSVWHKK